MADNLTVDSLAVSDNNMRVVTSNYLELTKAMLLE